MSWMAAMRCLGARSSAPLFTRWLRGNRRWLSTALLMQGAPTTVCPPPSSSVSLPSSSVSLPSSVADDVSEDSAFDFMVINTDTNVDTTPDQAMDNEKDARFDIPIDECVALSRQATTLEENIYLRIMWLIKKYEAENNNTDYVRQIISALCLATNANPDMRLTRVAMWNKIFEMSISVNWFYPPVELFTLMHHHIQLKPNHYKTFFLALIRASETNPNFTLHTNVSSMVSEQYIHHPAPLALALHWLQIMQQEGPTINTNIFNYVLHLASILHCVEKCVELFHDMQPVYQIQPDYFSHHAVIAAYARVGDVVAMLSALNHASQSGFVLKWPTLAVMMRGFFAAGVVGPSLEIYEFLKSHHQLGHLRSHNQTLRSLFHGLITNNSIEHFDRCWKEMLDAGMKPDPIMIRALVSAWGTINNSHRALQTFQAALNQNLVTLTPDSLRSLYMVLGKSGDFEAMYRIHQHTLHFAPHQVTLSVINTMLAYIMTHLRSLVDTLQVDFENTYPTPGYGLACLPASAKPLLGFADELIQITLDHHDTILTFTCYNIFSFFLYFGVQDPSYVVYAYSKIVERNFQIRVFMPLFRTAFVVLTSYGHWTCVSDLLRDKCPPQFTWSCKDIDFVCHMLLKAAPPDGDNRKRREFVLKFIPCLVSSRIASLYSDTVDLLHHVCDCFAGKQSAQLKKQMESIRTLGFTRHEMERAEMSYSSSDILPRRDGNHTD